MWMTRKRFREELKLALESERWPRPSCYSFSGGDPYVPPVDLRPSPKTVAHVDTVVSGAIAAALKPYAHLICNHDFTSKDSACERWTCTKCGIHNPRWEWVLAGLGSIWSQTVGANGEWKVADSEGLNLWYYRDWPKAKKGK